MPPDSTDCVHRRAGHQLVDRTQVGGDVVAGSRCAGSRRSARPRSGRLAAPHVRKKSASSVVSRWSAPPATASQLPTAPPLSAVLLLTAADADAQWLAWLRTRLGRAGTVCEWGWECVAMPYLSGNEQGTHARHAAGRARQQRIRQVCQSGCGFRAICSPHSSTAEGSRSLRRDLAPAVAGRRCNEPASPDVDEVGSVVLGRQPAQRRPVRPQPPDAASGPSSSPAGIGHTRRASLISLRPWLREACLAPREP